MKVFGRLLARCQAPAPDHRFRFKGKLYSVDASIIDLMLALTIAAIYRERWQIELFFKWIQQNLRIKSFVGHSTHAVMTQIWVAMIAYLLLSFLKHQLRLGWSLSQILRLSQLNLFERRGLDELLKERASPPDPSLRQTRLVFS